MAHFFVSSESTAFGLVARLKGAAVVPDGHPAPVYNCSLPILGSGPFALDKILVLEARLCGHVVAVSAGKHKKTEPPTIVKDLANRRW